MESNESAKRRALATRIRARRPVHCARPPVCRGFLGTILVLAGPSAVAPPPERHRTGPGEVRRWLPRAPGIVGAGGNLGSVAAGFLLKAVGSVQACCAAEAELAVS